MLFTYDQNGAPQTTFGPAYAFDQYNTSEVKMAYPSIQFDVDDSNIGGSTNWSTSYEIGRAARRGRGWMSDVCSSDLPMPLTSTTRRKSRWRIPVSSLTSTIPTSAVAPTGPRVMTRCPFNWATSTVSPR